MKVWMGKSKAIFLLSSLALILAGCGEENLSALIPKGYGAESSMDLIILSTIIMLFVFIIVMLIYIIVLSRFRVKKGQEDYIPKQVEGNSTLETVWTIIPIILVIILAVPTVTATFDLADESDREDGLEIEVTANQYWWHFNYEGQEIQTSQDMYIPTGERVHLDLISSDVIHSFWVPALAGKMDTNPENVNTMFLETEEEGVYYGKCAELCGPSHSLMDFKVIAVSPEEFEQWVEDMQNVDPEEEPQDAVAQDGKAAFEENNCMGCHAIGSSPSQVGPNLTGYGDRTTVAGILEPTKENLVEWLIDPESIKPGNEMTGNYPELSDEDANDIAEYLMQLEASEVTPESVEN
ncbi:cytochrome c oxidase subunit 2 [Virgibacillus natechei]|uniref:Cytochrome c oxidase subunit 2 n=1 Tax=Virgibacillus natechei TaxID=1216297 RepID=A0ABS4IBC5_9BACI|nr:cytochrome c oxidase subunit II [Virgibacillus natechei]MBP1968227.1 cytochrome c oxidase subunit 2 [Virgibacillus natechei]UZD14502.1 cytochrome c oxidase subunit II [Virgibacillus natechei]